MGAVPQHDESVLEQVVTAGEADLGAVVEHSWMDMVLGALPCAALHELCHRHRSQRDIFVRCTQEHTLRDGRRNPRLRVCLDHRRRVALAEAA